MEPTLDQALDRETGLPVHELVPLPAAPRVVGPGRLERQYQDRIRGLEERRHDLEQEVDTLALLQRGADRRQDRLERELTHATDTAERERQVARRLLVGVGALQKENELLRQRCAQLEAAASPPARLAAPRRKSFLARLLGK